MSGLPMIHVSHSANRLSTARLVNMTSGDLSFMKSPLVTWVKTLHEDAKTVDIKTLSDGIFLHHVWLQIDPHPQCQGVIQGGDEISVRIRNLGILLHNIKAFYEDVLGQVVLMKLPDITKLGKSPHAGSTTEELHTLLLLILGSAVQCEHKEHFIENIKSLDITVQHAIVECIQQITDNPNAVWTNDWSELTLIPEDEQGRMYGLLVQHVHRLVKERDDLAQRIVDLVLEQENRMTPSSSSNCLSSPTSGCSEKPHLVVELADVKSRLRRVQQELEEKNELIAELKEELEQTKELYNKLRQENLELVQDARTAKAYRDEIDILKERVRKVDRLESEIQRYKDRMNELDFYKSRVEELREDNRILTETKTMLEEQLDGSRKRADQVPDLEAEILKYRACVNELMLEKDRDREKVQQLLEENAQLHLDKKAAVEELIQVQGEFSCLRSQLSPCHDNSLLEQLNNDAQTRALKLELENQRLQSLVENLKNLSFHSSIDKDLTDCEIEPVREKPFEEGVVGVQLPSEPCFTTTSSSSSSSALSTDKAELLAALQQENMLLHGDVQRLHKAEKDALQTVAELQGHNRKLMDNVEDLQGKLEAEKMRCDQLELSLQASVTENQKLQRLVDGHQKRLSDLQQEVQALESENHKLNTTIESLRSSVHKLNNLERENTNFEAENHRLEQEKKSYEKEVCRLKQAIESKDVTIDGYSSKVSCLELENKQLQKEVENVQQMTARAKELEKDNKDLNQLLFMNTKTVNTLRQDLVSEKIKVQQLTSELERITSVLQKMGISKTDLLDEGDNKDWPKILEDILEEKAERKVSEKNARFLHSKAPKEPVVKLQDELRMAKEWENEEQEVEKDASEQLSKDEGLKNEGKEVDASLEDIKAIKERIIDLEKRNSSLEDENSNFRKQSSSLKEQNSYFQSHVKNLEQRLSAITKQNAAFQSEQAKLQVENSLIASQNASLQAQIETLRAQVANLEDEKNRLNREVTECQATYNSLLKSHEALQDLHEQLTSDYERLATTCSALKVAHKNLKAEHKVMKEKLQAWAYSQEEMLKMKEVLEGSQNDANTDSRNLASLRTEHMRLKDELKSASENYDKLQAEYKSLQVAYKTLKTENNELKLKHTALQGEMAECRDKMATLDVEVSKLSTYCEAMSQTNTSLEEHRRSLVSSVTSLIGQYHELLTQMVDEQTSILPDGLDLYEKLHDLFLKKEKLEELIRDYDWFVVNACKRRALGSSVMRRMQRSRTDVSLGLTKPKHTTEERMRVRRSLPSFGSDLPGGSDMQQDDDEGHTTVTAKHTKPYLNSYCDLGQEDHIPVRDVGPDIASSSSPGSVAIKGQKTEKAHSDMNVQTPPEFLASHNTSDIPKPLRQTTVENHMTVSLITSPPAHPSQNGDPEPTHLDVTSDAAGIANNGLLLRSNLQPQSPYSGAMHSLTSYTPSRSGVFVPRGGSSRTGTPLRNTGLLTHVSSSTSSSSTPSVCSDSSVSPPLHPPLDNSSLCSDSVSDHYPKQRCRYGKEGSDPPTGRGKHAENSVWYEYGCV